MGAGWDGVYYRQLTVSDAGASNGDYFLYAASNRQLVSDHGAMARRVTALESAMASVGSSNGAITQGPAATIAIGNVSTLPATAQATVSNAGTPNAAVLEFGIPAGPTGSAASITVSQQTTWGNAATPVSVTNVGTAQAANLQFTFPDLSQLVNPDVNLVSYHDQLVADFNAEIASSALGPIWSIIPGTDQLAQNFSDGELIAGIESVRAANYLYSELQKIINNSKAKKAEAAKIAALGEVFIKFTKDPTSLLAILNGYQTGTADGLFTWSRPQTFAGVPDALTATDDTGNVKLSVRTFPGDMRLFSTPLTMSTTFSTADTLSEYSQLYHDTTQCSLNTTSPHLVLEASGTVHVVPTLGIRATPGDIDTVIVDATGGVSVSETLTLKTPYAGVDPVLSLACSDGVNTMKLSCTAVAGSIECTNDLRVTANGVTVLTADATGLSMAGPTVSTAEATLVLKTVDSSCVTFTPAETVFSAQPIVCQEAYYVSVDPATKLVTQAQLDDLKTSTPSTTGSGVADSLANLGGDMGTLFGTQFTDIGSAAVGGLAGAMMAAGLGIHTSTDPQTGSNVYQVVQEPSLGGIATERLYMFTSDPLNPQLAYVIDGTGLAWSNLKDVPTVWDGQVAESNVTGLVSDLASKLETSAFTWSNLPDIPAAVAGFDGTMAESNVIGLVSDLASINDQLSQLGASSAGMGVSKLDVETVTTNGATLSLVKDSYFAPGITPPTGMAVQLAGIAVTPPAQSGQWDNGIATDIAPDANGISAFLPARMETNTDTAYIQNLDGTPTAIPITQTTSSGTVYCVRYDAAGKVQWAFAPLPDPGSGRALEGKGCCALPNGNTLWIFYLQSAPTSMDLLNKDGTVHTAGFLSGTTVAYQLPIVVTDPSGNIVYGSPFLGFNQSSDVYQSVMDVQLWNNTVVFQLDIQNSGISPDYLDYVQQSNPWDFVNSQGYGMCMVGIDAATYALAWIGNPVAATATTDSVYANGFAIDQTNNCMYVCGQFSSASTGSPALRALTASGNSNYSSMSVTTGTVNAFVVKYNSSLQPVASWSTNIGQNFWFSITVDGSGNVHGVTANSLSTMLGSTDNFASSSYRGFWLVWNSSLALQKCVNFCDATGWQAPVRTQSLRYDWKNGLIYAPLSLVGTASAASPMYDVGTDATSQVGRPALPASGGLIIFVLDTSNDTWKYAFSPVSPSTSQFATAYRYTYFNGAMYFAGYIRSQSTPCYLNDGTGTGTYPIATSPTIYTAGYQQPFLMVYAFNDVQMTATLPLPTPSTGQYLEKTLFLQGGLNYVLTETNNSGTYTRVIPTPQGQLTTVQYNYIDDAWYPDFSTQYIVNNYSSTSTVVQQSSGNASELNGLTSAQFVRSDTASGVSCASSTRAFTVNNSTAGAQVASFQSNGTEALGVYANSVVVSGSLNVLNGISGSLPWSDLVSLPTYITYCQNLTSDAQQQLDNLRTGTFLPLSGGTVTGTVTATSFIANGSITCQSLSTSGAVTFDANNPAMLAKVYGAGDAYGLDQASGGQLNLYASTVYTPSAINLGFKDSSGATAAVLTVRNPAGAGSSPSVSIAGSLGVQEQLYVDSLAHVQHGPLQFKWYNLGIPAGGNFVQFNSSDLLGLDGAGMWKLYGYGMKSGDAECMQYYAEATLRFFGQYMFIDNVVNRNLYFVTDQIESNTTPASFTQVLTSVFIATGTWSWPSNTKVTTQYTSDAYGAITLWNNNGSYQLDEMRICAVMVCPEVWNGYR